MKFSKNMILLTVIAFVVAFSLASFTHHKKADAQVGASQIILQAISFAQRFLGDKILGQSIDTIAGIAGIVMDGLYPAMERDMQDAARERNLAQQAGANYDADLAAAEMAYQQRLAAQKAATESLLRSRITRGECSAIQSAKHGAAARNSAKAYKIAIEECIRKETSLTDESCLSELLDMPTTTALQKMNALLAFRQQYTCSKDEHGGNIREWCQNTDPKNVDKDLCGALLIGDRTIPKDMFKFIPSCIALVVQPSMNNPLRKGIEQDPNLAEQYIKGVRATAEKVTGYAILGAAIADRLEPEDDDCPARKEFVNAIDAELGLTPDPNRPCPANRETMAYRNFYDVERPLFAEECAGSLDNESVGNCELAMSGRVLALKHLTQGNIEKMNLLSNMGGR